MAKTVVGLMDSRAEADSVVQELISRCNCDQSDISVVARGEAGEYAGDAGHSKHGGETASGAMKGAGAGAALGGIAGLIAGAASLAIPGVGPIIAAGPIASALAGAGVGALAGGLIGGLVNSGVPEDEAHYYAEGVKRGGTLITVHARSDDVAECAEQAMKKFGAADIDQRASDWKQQGWRGRFDEKEEVIPVAQEELTVGKRQVSQGKARAYSYVTETPVEETVRLREQHAQVERQPVNRPVQAGDSAFQERSIEVPETTEEPVISKRSRVTEEVRVGTQASEREETVRDTVRKSDVRVERSGEGAGRGRYGGPERRARNVGYSGADRRLH